ncbi:MAG TPA: hypothetical protein GXZ82_01100 [Firmicutes bacterium]|nr:hypothetical protein [Bacillota bacterium]
MDKRIFLHPDNIYRPIPFWSWNDQLEPQRIIDQAEAFAAVGMGGYFMHARPGIRTPFLSEEWFAAIDAAVQTAQEHGLQAWIYDECSYPSGFAAGLVPRNHPHLTQKYIRCYVLGGKEQAVMPEQGYLQLLGLYAVSAAGYRPWRWNQALSNDEIVIKIVVEQAQPSSWLNGTPYVDTLHPESGKAFIAAAYEPYAQRYAKYFGSLIPGVFTDEPYFGTEAGDRALPWTPGLTAIYQEEYGEHLIERLPELFLQVGDYTVTRTRYWRLVTELFTNNWLRPIYAWCERHNLQFTGHLWEHVLAPHYQGSMMAPLEYMHMPGLDLLGRDANEARRPQSELPRQIGNVHMVKTVSSVAHQLGRKRVLSETYGGCGWDATFEMQKRYADWEFALGVNFLNQHLSHYSLRGYRKHDYPISFQAYQPWWPWYKQLSAYFGRLSYALSQGEYQAELLVLHPMSTIWANWQPPIHGVPQDMSACTQDTVQVSALLEQLTKELAAANWGFDFGDELLLEKYWGLGFTGTGRPLFQVRRMKYQAIIVPGCVNLLANTKTALELFMDLGGKVWFIAPWPRLVDGRAESDAWLPAQCCVETTTDLLAQLEEQVKADRLSPSVRCSTSTPSQPIYHITRRTDKGRLVFLSNIGTQAHLKEQVRLSGIGTVQRWDLMTGQVETLPASEINGGMQVELDFAYGESHLLYLTAENDAKAKQAGAAQPSADQPGLHHPRQVAKTKELASSWRFQRQDPNVALLDRCTYRIGDGPWSEPVFTQQAVYNLRRRYGLTTNPFRDVQPWLKHPAGAPRMPDTISLRYVVQSQLPPPSHLWLVLEDAHDYTITINGHVVDDSSLREPSEWWLDPAFTRIPIHHLWREGKNVIRLQCRFHADLALEPAILLGDFAVYLYDGQSLILQPEPETLQSGSWVEQGYPFFVGKAIYRQQVRLTPGDLAQRIWLDCSDLPNMVKVYCNGHEVGLLSRQPYRAELTPWLHAGENDIELLVANSLHNVFGPLHTPNLPEIVGPPQYTYDPSWTPEYHLVKDGIAAQVRLLFAPRSNG